MPDPSLLRCGTGPGRDTGTNLPVVELPVDVDLPLSDEARQVGDGVGDVWGKAGRCEPQKHVWLLGRARDVAVPHAGG